MKQTLLAILFVLTITLAVPAAYAQQDDEAARIRTRTQLAALLEKAGPGINVIFSQSQKQPFNYVSNLKQGLMNSNSFEIVVSVTPKQTIGFRIYPHYNNGYINIDKVRNSPGLMRQLLQLSNRTFLYWGADETGDVFVGYTFTLESGFPEESIRVVLRSIVNMDKYVGELRPNIDGTGAPATATP